ncbi:MAG TPA: ATP-binding protein [Opitutales bacterium]|nr:ATP-binding protein [Opitutales bacterium]
MTESEKPDQYPAPIAPDGSESDWLRAAVEMTSEGFTIFDGEANILYESPANTRITGYSVEEMRGTNLFQYIHPDEREAIRARFQLLATDPGGSESATVRFLHKQGHWIFIEGTVVNRLDDPRVRGMINNFRDVTAKIEAERELRRAQEAATEAHRLQQNFLANLSHEFRTPLTLIREPLKDLRGADPNETNATLWKIVERNLVRLDGLIHELIELSLTDAGAISLRARLEDTEAFLREEIDSLKEAAKAKKITLKTDIGHAPPLYFDRKSFCKVVSNLLSNAIKFTPEGGEVELSTQFDRKSERVYFYVTDSGPGIPPHEIGNIFKRFYQIKDSPRQPADGMGLGLALAREAIELHGGEIGAESILGRGCRFWFWLPTGAAHLHPDEIDLSADRHPHRARFLEMSEPNFDSPQGATPVDLPELLLVEDYPDMRHYLKLNLEAGYRVTEAQDGQEALAAIARRKPAIVLSDVMMPRIDGLELCRQIRSNPETADLPILLLSAIGQAEDRTAGLEAGADDYLSKPFFIPELLLRLKKLQQTKGDRSDEPAGNAVAQWRKQVISAIHDHLTDPEFNVTELARAIGLSKRQLQRRCREVFGQRPGDLIRNERLAKARKFFARGTFETVSEVAHAVGLTPNYLSRLCRSIFGKTPKELRGAETQ